MAGDSPDSVPDHRRSRMRGGATKPGPVVRPPRGLATTARDAKGSRIHVAIKCILEPQDLSPQPNNEP
ncbi:hypothetical protein GCM10029978_049930 [Actinoallomurus acanthiterrae]